MDEKDLIKPYHILRKETEEAAKHTVDKIMPLLKGKTYNEVQTVMEVLEKELREKVIV